MCPGSRKTVRRAVLARRNAAWVEARSTVAAATAGLLLTVTAPSPGGLASTASFRDWRVACDNVGRCMAVGLAAQDEDGTLDALPYVVVERDAGPAGRVVVSVVPDNGGADNPAPGESVVVTLSGEPQEPTFTGRLSATAGDQAARVVFRDAEAMALVAGVVRGRQVLLSVAGQPGGAISLAGSAAALRWMDERQGRVGGVTALVAAGPSPASAVSAAKPLPVVRLAPVVPQGDLPAGLPAALAARSDVKRCAREQSDPLGEFPQPGVEARLSENEYLWAIPCGRGAYNFSTHYIIARRDGSRARSPWLGGGDRVVNAGYDPATRTLGAFYKARGLGDCGTEDVWGWTGTRFVPLRRAQTDDCSGVMSDDWLVTWRAEPR